MLMFHLTILSTILQYVYLLPVDTNKHDKKRSLDIILKPFDVEYKPIDVPSDIPVSFQETIQFWNSLSEGPSNQGIVLGKPFTDEFENGQFASVWNDPGEYPDPYLLRGLAAKRAALILYSKELFFSDFPHERALSNNQEMRRLNGLPGNKLGSLRPNSFFSRGHHNG
ncbi:uncharacterized protein LOC123310091 [Coccinella septempunctata]|uniref:uncharacterized protein LOC123310091 n=1 Tax=Coccinella septempunctata TaxID=41139 RepID=UPI001D08CDBF|nr:uncharacterized protein LOC123310091 [Coccinella septempunctata]